MCESLRSISRGSLDPIKLSPDIDTYADSSRHYIVKFFKSPESSLRMSRTIELLNRIKSARPDFPCVIPERVGEGVYAEEYVDGVIMGSAELSEEDSRDVCAEIVGYMAGLRKLGCLGLAEEGYSWRGYLSAFAEERIAAVVELGVWDLGAFREFFAYVREGVRWIPEPERFCIVHNDLNPDGNILIDGKRVRVIDYEKWIVGDCVKDTSKLIWYFRRHKRFADTFIGMYSESVCVPDMRAVKLYFALDILNHFAEYRKLITQNSWKLYFQQELEIIQELWKDDFPLW